MPSRAFITKIIKEAGRIARVNFCVPQKISWKKNRSVLTETDLKIDKYLTSQIKKYYPSHGIISEESPVVHSRSEYTWFIDPIDGTINFSQGIPYFCIAIAVARGDTVIQGAVYDPIHKELFYAEEGKITVLNDKPICSNAREKLKNAFIDFEVWKNATYDLSSLEQQLSKKIYVPAKLQCLMLSACYITVGRIDAGIFAGNTPWDVAPIYPICERAGVKITDLDGNRWKPSEKTKGAIIARPKLHKSIMKEIKKLNI